MCNSFSSHSARCSQPFYRWRGWPHQQPSPFLPLLPTAFQSLLCFLISPTVFSSPCSLLPLSPHWPALSILAGGTDFDKGWQQLLFTFSHSCLSFCIILSLLSLQLFYLFLCKYHNFRVRFYFSVTSCPIAFHHALEKDVFVSAAALIFIIKNLPSVNQKKNVSY